tara:strand:+ start:1119 stop:1301 length:183 start_codon:yes stop_codon:yes gene_type:complete
LLNQVRVGLDGTSCQLNVTFGRFLALFALAFIAAVWLQWSWMYWLLAAAALWALFKLVRS